MAEATHYHLFIVYTDEDAEWVEGFLIPTLGIPSERIITKESFRPGADKVAEFERAVTRSRYTLLVLNPAFLGDVWAMYGKSIAAYSRVQHQSDRLLPLIRKPCTLPPHLDALIPLDCTDETRCQREIKRLREILEQPEPTITPILCPYPGMVPFSEANSKYFFGRDREIQELLQHLRLHPFITVIGPSGSGKSSLVFAGLIPALKSSGLFGPGEWLVRTMRPGETPLTDLQHVLGDSPSFERLLLIVDQFEEVFTSAGQEALPFQETLQQLIETRQCFVVLTVRADFYPDIMNSILWDQIQAHRMEVVPLSESGLREAITKPSENMGVFVETTLVERLIKDAAGEPGVLPFVQEAMNYLWEKREHRFLPLRAYETLGDGARTGLQAAMAMRADAAFAKLSKPQQIIARRILLRLVQFGEGRPDTRRQRTITALRSADDTHQEFKKTLENLVTERLLTRSGKEGEKEPNVDIAHEILITAWPLLGAWISEYREAESFRRHLQARTQNWLELKRQGGLLDQIEISGAMTWLSSESAKELGVNTDILEFITASQKTVRKTRRMQWLRPLLAVIIFIVIVSASFMAYRSWYRSWLYDQATEMNPPIKISGGLATIGTNDPDFDEYSYPEWQVKIPSFEIDQHEVSNAQYCLCRRAGICTGDPGYSTENVCDDNLAEYPVTNITLFQAEQFCRWLGRRLPTEIEWEWTARGSEKREFPIGDKTVIPGQVNIVNQNVTSLPLWPVSKPSEDRTQDGVLGMTGNVHEWTVSLYLPYTHPEYRKAFWHSEYNWPEEVSDAMGFVITRGGSWRTGADRARAYARYPIIPGESLNDLGFRCLKDLPLK